MQIHAWTTDAEDTPEAFRAISRIRHAPQPVPGKPGKLVEDWHPVVFHAATREAVIAKAQVWWDEQIAAEQRKADNAKAAGERMHARKAGAQ